MSDFNRGYPRTTVPASAADMAVDAGLRAFMLGIYNKMALGLVLSAVLAFVTSQVEPVRDLMFRTVEGSLVGYTPLGLIVAFAPIGILLLGQFAVRQSPRSSGIVYWAVVALLGASLGNIALLYRVDSIFAMFLVTACAFGGLSLFGYVTKRDLTGFGSFLIIGLIGIIVASLVNLFLHSGALAFAVNVIGVLVFAGLTAYDTQRLKLTYYRLGGDSTSLAVATNYGALSLYLNFLNLFLFLLRMFGGRR
jgi:FtsH-binding integral membrane protein